MDKQPLKPWRCMRCGLVLGRSDGVELRVGNLRVSGNAPMYVVATCPRCKARRRWAPGGTMPDDYESESDVGDTADSQPDVCVQTL